MGVSSWFWWAYLYVHHDEVLTYHLKVKKINILFRGSRPYHFRGKLDMINGCCFLCTYWLTSYGCWLYAYSDKSTFVKNVPWLNVTWPCDMYPKDDTGALSTWMSYIFSWYGGTLASFSRCTCIILLHHIHEYI